MFPVLFKLQHFWGLKIENQILFSTGQYPYKDHATFSSVLSTTILEYKTRTHCNHLDKSFIKVKKHPWTALASSRSKIFDFWVALYFVSVCNNRSEFLIHCDSNSWNIFKKNKKTEWYECESHSPKQMTLEFFNNGCHVWCQMFWGYFWPTYLPTLIRYFTS